MRAVLLEPLIVATSLPFASGLARFTNCELPKEAGLFSPDIFKIQLWSKCQKPPDLYEQLFLPGFGARYSSR